MASYIALHKTGELRARANELARLYESCALCPRLCKVNRNQGVLGGCFSGALPAIASHTVHFGEEPPISGISGSGTIFFANCNLQCVFCQNSQISHMGSNARNCEVSIERLAEIMLELQNAGCHNINFVSPTHFAPSIVAALCLAADQGLRLPLVYNSNGYDSLEALKLLDGVIDIYMPDLKYSDAPTALRLSGIKDYPTSARAAIAEMFRQTGELQLDSRGLARRGVLVRHLVLPGGAAGSVESLRWLADEVSPRIALSVMAQYYPANEAALYPPLDRKVSLEEYLVATDVLEELGLDHGWVQSHAESPDCYRPDFDKEAPFEQNE